MSLKCCPKSKTRTVFGPISIYPNSSVFPKVKFGLGKNHNKKVEYLLFQANCNGVKVHYIVMKNDIFFNAIN